MSHNPDFQKDEIMAHKKREIERQIKEAQEFAANVREFHLERQAATPPPTGQTGVDEGLEPEQRCPNCHTKFQRVRDVDARINALSRRSPVAEGER